ncbi:MAG: DNA polymerase [Streptosporangiaceae bacterium]
MTQYLRTCGGHTLTVHAPRAGELDPAAVAAFAAAEPVLGLDVETSAIDDHGPRFFGPGFTLRLVQFGSEREAWVLDMADPAQRDTAAAVLADPARRFVTHTAFDVLAVWSALGIPLGQRVADTHLLSKLLDPDERAGHGLKELSARHLDGGLAEAETALHARMRALAPAGHRAGNAWLRWGWDHLPADDEAYVVYAGLDAIHARRLLPVLLAACGPFAHLARLDTWLAAQATGITIRGLRLDQAYTRGLLADLEAEHAAADTQISGALGCPGGSPKFAEWLDAQATAAGITSLSRTPTGRLQVTADSLTALLDQHADTLPAGAAELARARLAMSKASNLIANLRGFLAAADPAGRVHPQVNTLRAKTARMSITGPTLQTLKKHDPRLRRCFVADPGHVLISCDFSQVEVRVAATLAEDPTLKEVILSGADIHDATARLMYGEGFTDEQRTISKRATFGTIYGGGARALAAQTGVSEDTARRVIQRWRRTYPRVIAYGQRLAALAEVVTASGRHIPADPARPYANANYAVQSTARDLLLAAVYALVTRHRVGGLWLFVHDEVIVQAREDDAERVCGLLEQAMTSTFRGLPIVAEAKILGPSWGRSDDPAAPPLPGICGTCGTSGTFPGQQGSGGFRRPARSPEPPEPSPPPPAPPGWVPADHGSLARRVRPVTHKVLVTGSRTWTDETAIAAALREHWHDGNALLISGACPRGADAIAERIWRSQGGLVEHHPADWDTGRDAGMRRNAAMVARGADVCLAFIRDHSPGASHTARLAERAGIPVRRYTDPQEDTMPLSSPAAASLLDAALCCAARGWRVFPVRPRAKKPPAFPDHKAEDCAGTDPRCRSGHQGWEPRATTNADRIERAWARTPYNIGIATGPSGLIVIDLDTPKPGEVPPPEWALPGITSGADVLAALCERHGQPWPAETFTVRTRRGGLHLYFTAPPDTPLRNTSGRSERGLGWLIDTRGHGGYVLAPGSFVDLQDGTAPYEVVYGRCPAALPDWLAGLLTASPIGCHPAAADQVRDLDRYAASALNREIERVRGAVEGGRNHTLNKAAFHLGQLIAAGMLPELVASAELHAAASVHFGVGTPPFTSGDAHATIRAGIAAGKRKPRPLATLGAAA